MVEESGKRVIEVACQGTRVYWMHRTGHWVVMVIVLY